MRACISAVMASPSPVAVAAFVQPLPALQAPSPGLWRQCPRHHRIPIIRDVSGLCSALITTLLLGMGNGIVDQIADCFGIISGVGADNVPVWHPVFQCNLFCSGHRCDDLDQFAGNIRLHPCAPSHARPRAPAPAAGRCGWRMASTCSPSRAARSSSPDFASVSLIWVRMVNGVFRPCARSEARARARSTAPAFSRQQCVDFSDQVGALRQVRDRQCAVPDPGAQQTPPCDMLFSG